MDQKDEIPSALLLRSVEGDSAVLVCTSALYLPLLSSTWALEIQRGRRVSQPSPSHDSPPYHILEDFFLKSKLIVAVSKLFEYSFPLCEFEYCFSPQEETLHVILNFKAGLNCTFLPCPDCRYRCFSNKYCATDIWALSKLTVLDASKILNCSEKEWNLEYEFWQISAGET